MKGNHSRCVLGEIDTLLSQLQKDCTNYNFHPKSNFLTSPYSNEPSPQRPYNQIDNNCPQQNSSASTIFAQQIGKNAHLNYPLVPSDHTPNYTAEDLLLELNSISNANNPSHNVSTPLYATNYKSNVDAKVVEDQEFEIPLTIDTKQQARTNVKSPDSDAKSRSAFLSLSPTQLSKESKNNVEHLLAELNDVIQSSRKNQQIATNPKSSNYTLPPNNNFEMAQSRILRSPPGEPHQKLRQFIKHPDDTSYVLSSKSIINTNSKFTDSTDRNQAGQEENFYSSISETLNFPNETTALTFNKGEHPKTFNTDEDKICSEMLTVRDKIHMLEAGKRSNHEKSNHNLEEMIGKLERDLHIRPQNDHYPNSPKFGLKSDNNLNFYRNGTKSGEHALNTSTSSLVYCQQCNEPIMEHSIHALGYDWHPEHFVCVYCKKEIGTANFFEYQGQPWCENDYHSKFSPKCADCGEPILEKCVTALDQTWHQEHFKCMGACGRPFEPGEPYHVISDAELLEIKQKPPINTNLASKISSKPDDTTLEKIKVLYPFCREDYYAMFAPRCRACSNPILENFVSALDAKWHPDCFVCKDCHMPFGKGSFYECRDSYYSGNEGDGTEVVSVQSWPVCQTHYELRRRSGGSITGVGNIGGRGTPNGSNFNNLSASGNNVPSSTGNTFGCGHCFACGKPISPGAKCVTALHKKFHPHHFVCAFCLKQLTGTFKEVRGKPYCHACFDKLV